VSAALLPHRLRSAAARGRQQPGRLAKRQTLKRPTQESGVRRADCQFLNAKDDLSKK
jgi:hypothetical protein